MVPLDSYLPWTTQPQLIPQWLKLIGVVNSLVHLPLSSDLMLFASKEYQNSLHFQLAWRGSHAHYFSYFTLTLSLFLALSCLTYFLILRPIYCNFSVIAAYHVMSGLFFFFLFWPLIWSYCKYFQYSITIPKSLNSFPGGKQNSHLRFSCGAFSANIIAARPPPSAGPQTTHLSAPTPHHHNVPFLFLFFF